MLFLLLAAGDLGNGNLPYIGPYLQDVSENSISIMWVTNRSEISKIEYKNDTFSGIASNNDHQCIASPRTACFHRINLNGLKSDSSYSYRVHFNDSLDLWTDFFTFHTAPDPGTPYRLVVYGDNRLDFPDSTDASRHSNVVKQIIKHNPEMIIHLGDFALNGRCYDQWIPQFFSPVEPYLHNISFFTTIGNHEVKNFACPDINLMLYDYFFPNKRWYAFTYGNARFIGLQIENEGYNINKFSAQLDWLNNELNSSEYLTAKWHFVFFHSSVYTSDVNHTNNRKVINQLDPIFQKAGVNMVFSGHSHTYERSINGKVYYIVLGGGGADISRFRTNISSNSQVRVLDYNHATLDISPDVVGFNAWYNNGSLMDNVQIR